MVNKLKKYFYFYFSEPLRQKYNIDLKQNPFFEIEINRCKVKFFSDENKIDLMTLEIDRPEEDPYFLASLVKSYVESILKLSFCVEFRFSDIVTKATSEYEEGQSPKIKDFELDLTFEKTNPSFKEKEFRLLSSFFSHKPFQLELFVESLNKKTNPFSRYISLYKIIEYEYHLVGKRDIKRILKNSEFKKILSKKEYGKLKDDTLIEFIVDTRDKCSHLKKSEKEKYGYVYSNPNHRKEVLAIIPFMQEICMKVINPDAEIIHNSKKD